MVMTVIIQIKLIQILLTRVEKNLKIQKNQKFQEIQVNQTIQKMKLK